MTYMKLPCLTVLLAMVAACSHQSDDDFWADVNEVQNYEHEVIVLENLTTRTVAHCYVSAEYTAEECAQALEEKGYVRLNEIPRFTASDSTLDTNTYPTRRWRSNNNVPRW